ncbi:MULTISPECIES: hypothetical protein [unclassified Nonomuraea]|uniref:hypothetical protein n=1 Tax=unclassified Nonomuraea TaxID=2593643 RepID=UPI0033F473B9
MTTFVTLGPEGTDHEYTLRRYLTFQGIPEARILLVDDLLDGLETVRGTEDCFLLQNTAHPDVATVTERYWAEVRVVDCFVAPTKPMAILRRADVPDPRNLAVMPATVGYLRPGEWPELISVRAKPLIGQGLLTGRYEAGLTHLSWAHENPDRLVVIERIGPVDTGWLVYGRAVEHRDELTGLVRADLYASARS